MNGSSAHFAELFARERLLVMQERHRQAIQQRWAITTLAVVLALARHLHDTSSTSPSPSPWGSRLISFVANAIALLLHRAGASPPGSSGG